MSKFHSSGLSRGQNCAGTRQLSAFFGRPTGSTPETRALRFQSVISDLSTGTKRCCTAGGCHVWPFKTETRASCLRLASPNWKILQTKLSHSSRASQIVWGGPFGTLAALMHALPRWRVPPLPMTRCWFAVWPSCRASERSVERRVCVNACISKMTRGGAFRRLKTGWQRSRGWREWV